MELAEYPAEVKFLCVQLATERLLISFYAFGGCDRIIQEMMDLSENLGVNAPKFQVST